MDGIVAITQRIAEIEATLRTVSAPRLQAPVEVRSASFEHALGQAVDDLSQVNTVDSPTASWSAAGIPADLVAYGNGKIPPAALTNIAETGHRLWAPAGESFEQLRADATKDGVTIGITDSYRSYESQVEVAERKGLYTQGGLAAAPGTSQHGWGVALDLKLDPQAQAWMRTNARHYGFVEDTPREPWHWVYKK